MSDFEWHSEDDFDWDAPQTNPDPSPKRWQRIVIPLLLIILIAGAGYVVFTQLQGNVEEAVSETETDIRSSFDLFYEKASEGDIEVFNTLLSGRDREWTVAQQLLVGDVGLLNREAFRLKLVSEIPEIRAIDMEADLSAATITGTVEYAIPIGNGLTDTISLQLPTIFRRGETQWLYAPPLPEYWGEEESRTSSITDATMSTRDAAIIRELLADIDQLYLQLCHSDEVIACEVANRVEVVFSTDAHSLVELQRPALALDEALVLPTPTLVGLPTDGASYRALLAGYADHILTPLVADAVEYRCCSRAAIFRALMDQHLQDLGLVASELSAETYASALENIHSIPEANLNWDTTPLAELPHSERNQIRIWVDFLHDLFPTSIGLMQGRLNSFSTFNDFLSSMVATGDARVALGFDWRVDLFTEYRLYLIRNGTLVVKPPPIPFPEQDVLVACNDEGVTSFMRYDFQSEQWDTHLEASAVSETVRELSVYTLPTGDGLLLQSGNLATNGPLFDLTIYRDGFEPTSTHEQSGVPLAYFGHHSPDNNQLFVIVDPANNNSDSQFGLLDVNACTRDGLCEPTQIEGYPLWSADGKHIIAYDFAESTYLLTADGTVLTAIPTDQAAFWFDNETVGWSDEDRNIMQASIDPFAPQLFLAADKHAISERTVPPFVINGHLTDNILIASDDGGIMAFNPETFEQVAIEEDNDFFLSKVSPNGQFLATVGTFTPEGPEFKVITLATGDTRSYKIGEFQDIFGLPNWNADHEWLTSSSGGLLRLNAMNHPYSALFKTPSINCASAVWIAGE